MAPGPGRGMGLRRGFGRGRGFSGGRGFGFGMRHGWGGPWPAAWDQDVPEQAVPTRSEERGLLQREIAGLEHTLKQLRSRLEQIGVKADPKSD